MSRSPICARQLCCPAEADPSSVIKKDSAIRKPYVVALDTLAARHNAGPDVRLETADAPIDTTVYLTGRLARAARVQAATSDATLRLRVQREAGQAVDVSATTTNGESASHLPLPTGVKSLAENRQTRCSAGRDS